MDKWIFHTSAHSVETTKELSIQNNMKNVNDVEADAVKQIPLTSLIVTGIKACKISVWLLFDPEDEGNIFVQNIKLSPNYRVLQARRMFSSRYVFFGVMSRHGVADAIHCTLEPVLSWACVWKFVCIIQQFIFLMQVSNQNCHILFYVLLYIFFVFTVHLKDGFRVKKFWGNIALDYLPHLHHFVLHCLYYGTSRYLSHWSQLLVCKKILVLWVCWPTYH